MEPAGPARVAAPFSWDVAVRGDCVEATRASPQRPVGTAPRCEIHEQLVGRGHPAQPQPERLKRSERKKHKGCRIGWDRRKATRSEHDRSRSACGARRRQRLLSQQSRWRIPITSPILFVSLQFGKTSSVLVPSHNLTSVIDLSVPLTATSSIFRSTVSIDSRICAVLIQRSSGSTWQLVPLAAIVDLSPA
jgi:hypothetical protein